MNSPGKDIVTEITARFGTPKFEARGWYFENGTVVVGVGLSQQHGGGEQRPLPKGKFHYIGVGMEGTDQHVNCNAAQLTPINDAGWELYKHVVSKTPHGDILPRATKVR